MKIILETHSHFYPIFNKKLYFDSFIKNTDLKEKDNYVGFIFLTEDSLHNYFDLFKERSDLKEYKTKILDDLVTIRTENSRVLFYIIKSRQIVTMENLEVLLVGIRKNVNDGITIDTVIEQGIEDNLIIILPWGFGKWALKRKEIIKKIIKNYGEYNLFFIGDNYSRFSSLYQKRIFDFADKNSVRVLNGSDPLPFKGEEKNNGRLFSQIEAKLDQNNPFESLKKILEDRNNIIFNKGKRNNLFSFIFRQVKINFTKYFIR